MPVKVSIIIPTYNSEATIADTLNSIKSVASSIDSLEVIVVDGLSKDSTLSIVRNSGISIRTYSEPDCGIYDAMNKGLDYAIGDWVFYLGSDDILLPDFSSAVNCLADIDSSYYGNVRLSKDDSIYCGKFSTLKLQLKNICHQSVFYSKSALAKHRFDLKYKYLADYALNLKLWSISKTNFSYLPFELSVYNNQTGSSSKAVDISFSNSKQKIIFDNFGIFSYIRYLVCASVLKAAIRIPVFSRFWKTV